MALPLTARLAGSSAIKRLYVRGTIAALIDRALEADPAEFRRWFRHFLEIEMEALLPDLRRRVPRVTGRLRASAYVDRWSARGRGGLAFGFRVYYATFIIYARPHFRSRTVNETLNRYARSAKFRAALNRAADDAAERTLDIVRRRR